MALSKVPLLDDKADNLRLMAAGIYLIPVGGWVDRFCVDVKPLVVCFAVLKSV